MNSRHPSDKPPPGPSNKFTTGRSNLHIDEEDERTTARDKDRPLNALIDAVGGMMALPESIAKGRQAKVTPGPAPQSARYSGARVRDRPLSDEIPTVVEHDEEEPKRRGLTEEMPTFGESVRTHRPDNALVRSRLISISETAVSAMPSSSRDLWVLKDRDGTFASHVRILATRIEKIKETYGYKSFLFSSANNKEGKTVTVTNLALAMSEDSDRKVALIDANFREPRIAELFNLSNDHGLISAVSGESRVSECIARVAGRNLIVMTSGGTHANPALIISDPRFKSLLSDLTKSVDYLFVDAPSALPHADVPLLAQNVDAVMMVVASSNTKAGTYDLAINTIGKNRVVGHIFVDAPPKKMRTG